MSVSENNAVRFLNAFADIEREMNILAGSVKYTTFSKLLSRCVSQSRVIRANQEDLREYAELRNAIVHQRDDGDEIIAQPTDQVVKNIERISAALKKKQLLLSYATTPVICANEKTSVKNCFEIMYRLDSTKLPVYSEGKFAGMLTMSMIAKWGFTGAPEEQPALELLEKETPMRVVFFSRQQPLDDAVEVFTDALEKGKRAPVILITENGTGDEKPLGIVTAYDLPAVLAALAG